MEHEKILQTVISNLQKALSRDLSNLEIIFVKSQLSAFVEAHNSSELRESFSTFMTIIIKNLKDPKSIHKALLEPHQVDIHEMLKSQISENTQSLPISHPNDITSILGFNSRSDLLKLFNPNANIRTSYIILDRKFQNRSNTSLDTFSWELSLSGQGYNNSDSAISTSLPKNIIGAKIIPFRFPRTESAITFSKRLSINIQELEMHSYVSCDNRRRFHFLFTLIEDGSNPNDPYSLSNSGGENTTEFWLGKCVQHLNRLTLTFGNPFTKLSLDADRLPAIITATGIQALLTFTTPHFVSVNDNVTIENFITSNPSSDFVEIQLMNDLTGWTVSSVTSTTITIDVDLSSISGAITTPTSIYLDSKRFIIPLELKYLAN